MNNEILAEMYQLVEKAKMMEKIGQDDKALEIYLIIHDKYYPNTTNLFERPAILLEKKRRFDEAIAICEKAIRLIDENKITGTREHFQKRIDRIRERTQTLEPAEKPKVQAKAEEKEHLKFSKRDLIILGSAMTALVVAILIFALMPRNDSFDEVYDVISKMEAQSTAAAAEKFKSKPDPNLPVITASMVEKARSEIAGRPGVEDSYVVVSGDMVGLAIKVKASVTPSKARSLGNTFLRELASAASSEDAKFFSVNPVGYGKVYEYYSAFVVVSVNKDTVAAQGKLSKKSKEVRWAER